MSAAELKPCPFCGAKDERLVQAFMRATDTFAYWSVECLDCACEIANDASQAEADANWNMRAPAPSPALLGELIEALTGIDDKDARYLSALRDPKVLPGASGGEEAGKEAPYLADRFPWAAPGDQQEDAWLVRFCDRDCGDAIFTGPDAEREAWEHWNRYAPAFNIYVFRLAALTPPPPDAERLVRETVERCAKVLDMSRQELEPFVADAALAWCGKKARETFPEDIAFFRQNWSSMNGLRDEVHAAAIRALPTKARSEGEGK